MTESSYKRKIEIAEIHLQGLHASGNNEGFLQFKVNEDQIQKLTSKGLSNASWKEGLKLYTSIEDEIVVQGVDHATNGVIGQGTLKLRGVGNGKHTLDVDLTQDGKGVGQASISFNITINANYEQQTGVKGKLIMSNIRFECSNENKHGNTQIVLSLNQEEKRTSIVNNTDNKPQWKDVIEFPYKGDQNLNIKIVNVDSDERQVGNCSNNISMLVDKEGIFYNNQIYVYTPGNEQVGIIYTTLEYRPLDIGDDAKLYDLKRFMGKVQISNLNATLNRNTSADPNVPMDPIGKLLFNDQSAHTLTNQAGGQHPKWSDSFTFNLQKYFQFQLLEISIYGKNEKENELCGKAIIELSHFLSEAKEYPDQEVEVQYQQGPAGTLKFTAKSFPNDELAKYIAQKEEEQKQLKKKQEEEEQAEAKKKEQQKQQEEEKKKQEQEEEEKKKQQQQQEEQKKKQQQQQQEEEEAKKKQQQSQQEQQDDEEKKKQAQKQKEEEESKQKQNQEKEEGEKNKQNEKQKEGENQQEQKSEKENEKEQEQTKNNESSITEEKKKNALEKSINESKLSTKKLGDYYPAAKNLKNGFGLSEFQSAHTLQTSIHSTSFPKGQRFQSSILDKSSSPYFVLPSSFDAKGTGVRGPSFGYGHRDLINPTANPGPGTYESQSKFKKGNNRGYVFGESRNHCKNALGLMKLDMLRSESTKNLHSGRANADFNSGLKLPSINFANHNIPNYHYTKGSQSQVNLHKF